MPCSNNGVFKEAFFMQYIFIVYFGLEHIFLKLQYSLDY